MCSFIYLFIYLINSLKKLEILTNYTKLLITIESQKL